MSDTELSSRLRRTATGTEDGVEFSPAAAPLAEKLLEPALEIIARYPAGRGRSALLPLLHLVQTEEGHVSPRGVAFCAEHLGVGHDETTPDGRITLEHAECLAACDYAPVVTVNYDFAIDQATPEAAIGMVERLRTGERPMPSRGARICSLKEMQV